jgi:hypothetical protein
LRDFILGNTMRTNNRKKSISDARRGRTVAAALQVALVIGSERERPISEPANPRQLKLILEMNRRWLVPVRSKEAKPVQIHEPPLSLVAFSRLQIADTGEPDLFGGRVMLRCAGVSLRSMQARRVFGIITCADRSAAHGP